VKIRDEALALYRAKREGSTLKPAEQEVKTEGERTTRKTEEQPGNIRAEEKPRHNEEQKGR
jgi:hypothetical protein